MVCLLLSLTVSTAADTVTFRTNNEVNGRLSYAAGRFTLIAKYGKGTRTYYFKRADIALVEINPRFTNPGTPPDRIAILGDGLRDNIDSMGKTHDSSSASAWNQLHGDVIKLENGRIVKGVLIRMDESNIQCHSKKKEEVFTRAEVSSILVALD